MAVTGYHEATILVVDDEVTSVRLMERLLRQAGYVDIVGMADSRAALSIADAVQPDLVILDLPMPIADGCAMLERFRRTEPERDVMPILVLTSEVEAEQEAIQRAMTLGANDFLSTPLNPVEFLVRARNLLGIRFLQGIPRRESALLEERVRERTSALESAQLESLARLARITEYRDDTTGQHIQRVGRTAGLLARALELPAEQVEFIQLAAPLHDLGKVGIPDHVLLKPGKLDVDEIKVMRRHTEIAGEILAGSHFPIVQLAEQIARTHHERWDGLGYPTGIAGYAIPLAGRIVAVADVYDALTHDRPYRPAWPHHVALAEIERQCGRQFDPQIVAVFLRLMNQRPEWRPAPDTVIVPPGLVQIGATSRFELQYAPARQRVVA